MVFKKEHIEYKKKRIAIIIFSVLVILAIYLFKDASFLSIDEKDASFTPDKDDMISVNLKGTLYGFLLDEKKLI